MLSPEIHLKLKLVRIFIFHCDLMTSFTHKWAGTLLKFFISINCHIFLNLSPIFIKSSENFTFCKNLYFHPSLNFSECFPLICHHKYRHHMLNFTHAKRTLKLEL